MRLEQGCARHRGRIGIRDGRKRGWTGMGKDTTKMGERRKDKGGG